MSGLWWWVILGAAGLYFTMAGYLYLFQGQKVFLPPVGLSQTPEEWGLDYEEARFSSEGVELVGWWVPGRDEGAPVILFMHGNACNIGYLRDFTLLPHALGWSVMLFDYRGYGQSAGQPTEAGVYADAGAAWRYLTEQRGVAPRRIIAYGHSLGGGPAAWLAAEYPVGGVIIEGSFTSIPDLGAEIYPFLPVHWLARIHFDSRSRIGRAQGPVLIIHSPEDEVVPFHHGQRLFEAAREPKRFLQVHGLHDDGFLRMGAFAREHLGSFAEWMTEIHGAAAEGGEGQRASGAMPSPPTIEADEDSFPVTEVSRD